MLEHRNALQKASADYSLVNEPHCQVSVKYIRIGLMVTFVYPTRTGGEFRSSDGK